MNQIRLHVGCHVGNETSSKIANISIAISALDYSFDTPKSLMIYSNDFKALFFSILLALQFGLQPLISSKCTNSGVSKIAIVCLCELEKIVIGFILIHNGPDVVKKKISESWSFKNSLQLAALPATLYSIQNVLIQHSYRLIDSMTFNLLNQTKVRLRILCLSQVYKM